MQLRWRVVALTVGLVAVAAVLAYWYARPLWHPLAVRVTGGHTVAQRVAAIDARRQAEIEDLCAAWPPRRLTIIAYKQERELELWEPGHRVALFPILAASVGPGYSSAQSSRDSPGTRPNSRPFPVTSVMPRARVTAAITRLRSPSSASWRWPKPATCRC